MTRTYTITPKKVSDIAPMNFAESEKTAWYLEVFQWGIRLDGVGFYSEIDATHHGEKFITTGFIAGELD